jgi:carbamoyltransferase
VNILGISAFFHDSAAALVVDGKLVAAAQQERFSRRKHDADFPSEAIAYCLRRGDVGAGGIDAVAFYEKPITTFSRLLSTYLQVSPRGFGMFRQAMPLWLRDKLWVRYHLDRGLRDLGHRCPKRVLFPEHHESHAASAFFPSPFPSAAVLTFDGVGEWATSSIGAGRGNTITIERQLDFPHSIGLLYSAFTGHCGFRVNSGEYKLMGLAPYGEPTYVGRILDELVDLRDDGSFHLDMRCFGFLSGDRMTNARFDRLFDGPARVPEAEITQRELDLARSIQVVTEEIVLRLAREAARLTGERRACLAGGVALNCVANARLRRDGPFDEVWVQPAAGDAGGAVGAALYAWHQVEGGERRVDGAGDGMSGCALGPRFATDEIRRFLDGAGASYRPCPDRSERARAVAGLIAAGKVVALFTGRMEFGPRALGQRSILADARSPEMQSVLNERTKARESFRPFAPAVLEERAADWFDLDGPDPYMTFVADVAVRHRVPEGDRRGGPLDVWAARIRSDVPAVTHVDHSARVQTVSQDTSPELHAILRAFEDLTGCPMVINTSFNVRGEPIVCTPDDAWRCFMGTGIDHLVLEDCLLDKADQPHANRAGARPATAAVD